ncbi:hypothetical protein PMSD_19950 [Paenibacillus macquariensis subsp. defensor]|nr:hypothetical protein PMSD_19950 [Paenibacillus macquariensis subsp. defensor]
MELAFLKKNESHRKKPSRVQQLCALAGFMSFLNGLLSLAVINIGLLQQDSLIPFPSHTLSMISVILGSIGLARINGSKTYAWWGIGLNVFILIFYFMTLGLAWSINMKP